MAISDGANSSSASAVLAHFVPFQTGPSLERIPDDILHEILSYLPTLRNHDVVFGVDHPSRIPPDSLVRMPTLRALSRTSRLLRSRCLAMGWKSIELCGINRGRGFEAHMAIREIATAYMRVLKECPYLLPLIQTVSLCLTPLIFPKFAECLATLPNLTNIQVIHAYCQMTTQIKDEFEDKMFPSVRKISLPPCAHGIIRCCPNLEEVRCTKGNASPIIGSIVKGYCFRVHTIKGLRPPFKLKRLARLLPDLKYIDISRHPSSSDDMKELALFCRLNTIEICPSYPPTSVESRIKDASNILKKSVSKVEKRVMVIEWRGGRDGRYVTTEVIKV